MYVIMRAIGKYIIVDVVQEEVKGVSGLIVDTDELRYQRGVVIDAGSEVIGIHPGEVIYFDKHAGHSARIDDKPYTIVRERDVVVCV